MLSAPPLAVALESVAAFAATVALGAIAGVLLDHHWSPRLGRRRARRERERARRRRRDVDYAGRPFELDGVDFGLQVLFGTLGRVTRPHDVRATLLGTRWTAPARLRRAAAVFAERHGFHDGLVARLHTLDVETYADGAGAEHHRLRLGIMPTGYFDLLATNVALGPFTPATAPLLRGRGGLAETRLSNMIGLDLTLVTRDGRVPVFRRASGMAALQRCWQTSSGETMQLRVDVDTDGDPDVFETARRGLREELGVPPELIEQIGITAIVATPEYANVGVLMTATIGLTAAELEARLNRDVMTARDNWEYTEPDTIQLDDARELAAALTDPQRNWTKQAAASLVFAHAARTNGDVTPLAEAIRAGGSPNLEPGPAQRGVLPAGDRGAPERTRYCWRCGSSLPDRPPTRCDACGQDHYDNPKPCGEAVVVRAGRVLMVRRARSPWKDHWDLPGGFCDPGEHPRDAAVRELAEELGLRGRAVACLGIWMDGYGPPLLDGLVEQTANVAYLIELEDPQAAPTVDRNEVADVRWTPLDELPARLAFPDHVGQVLVAAQAAATKLPGLDSNSRWWLTPGAAARGSCLWVLSGSLGFAQLGTRIGTRRERIGVGSEGALDDRRLLVRGRVVGVDLRRGDVAMAQPLLEGAHRHAGRGHARTEGVAQVVRGVLRQSGGGERGGEPVADVVVAQRLAGRRVGEDERLVVRRRRRLVQPVERTGDLVGERDASRRAFRLRRAVLAAHVVLPHADAGGGPVDVLPAQGAQLADAQAGHGRRQEQRAVDLGVGAGGDGRDERADLLRRQEANVGVLLRLRQLHEGDGVVRRELLPLREREQRGEVAEVVAHGLRRQPLRRRALSRPCPSGQQVHRQALDVLLRDRVDRALAEERREVNADRDLGRAHRLGLAALALEVGDVPVADLGDREALADLRRGRDLAHEPTKLSLRLRTRQPVARARLTHGADLPLHLAAVDAPLAVPAAVVLEQGAAAVAGS
jgi:ADP-ribose pyrophosphatase YjhB (NUDIX family)